MSYQRQELGKLLARNRYPGRGIVIGASQDGRRIVSAYFIMGRSANSRNRVFVSEGETLTIYPADSTKVEDPSLIIYSPIRRLSDNLIVTNGDQTDTIYDFLREGNTFEEALETRRFEPDAPNWTPRISALVDLSGTEYRMSILKAEDAEGTDCVRYSYQYQMQAGLGHFLHTYQQDGDPLPSFSGEPERVMLPDSARKLADEIWENLDPDNKIALFVRYTDRESGEREDVLVNRYERVD